MATKLRDPASIDLDYVPRFRDGVVAIPVKDESVLYEEDTGYLHQLDPIATIVCGLFDGQAPLRQTVEELASAFDADPTVIEQDVLTLARNLGRKGLFPDVEGDPPPSEEDVVDC